MATIFRADTVGSLLRPPRLQEVRRAWMRGDLPTHEFKHIENHAVDEAIALQERVGLISTKRTDLESADALTARITDASRFSPREQLALSTQCGFASVFQGNPVTAAVQEAKLRLVIDVARRVWG